MPRQVEDRVVQMQFDNAKFEQNVKTSISTLDKLKKALNLDKSSVSMNDFTATTSKASSGTLAFANAMEVMKRKMPFSEILRITALMKVANTAINTLTRSIRAVTITPITTGFQEYETKMGAIQTIRSNTEKYGTTMEDVTQIIDRMNTYADKTIYNFAEMTRNLGTFTAAGVKLEDAASAIEGIANLAAMSGSTSQQAATAMYQLSQALAAGTVKLMDWNSVVNAGMGGAKFQEALKQTAREQGVAVDAMIEKHGSFRESLTEGWISADILNKTLSKMTVEGAKDYAYAMEQSGKYTAEQTAELVKQAQAAEDAATKVKTFSQLWSTIQESVQSNWGKTWELIIGDFEEAKWLFTSINDVVSGFIGKVGDAQNGLLMESLGSGWKQFMTEGIPVASHFQKFIKQMAIESGKFANMDEADLFIEEAGGWEESLQQGWVTTEMLEKATYSYAKTLSQLTPEQLKSKGYTREQAEQMIKLADAMYAGEISAEEFAIKMRSLSGRMKIFKGLGNIFSFIGDLLTPLLEGFGELFDFVTSDNLSSGIDKFYEWTKTLVVSEEVASALRAVGSGLASVFRTIGTAVSFVVKGFIKLITYLKPVWDGFISVGGAIGEFVSAIFGGIKFGDVFIEVFRRMGNAVKFAGEFIGGGLQNISKWIKDSIIPTQDILKSAGESISGSIEWIVNSFTSFGDSLMTVVSWLKIPFEKLKDPITAIIDLFSNFQDQLKSLDGLNNAAGILANGGAFYFFYIFSKKMKEIFASIGSLGSELAKTIHKLGNMFSNIGTYFKAKAFREMAESIKTIVLSMTVMLLAMAGLYVLFSLMPDRDAFDRMIAATTRMMLGIGTLIMALAILDSKSKAVADVDGPLDIVKQLIPSLKEMATMFKIGSVVAMFATAAVGIMAIAKSLQYFALGIEALGKIEKNKLMKGLMAVAVLMGLITAMIAAMSHVGFGAIIIGPALAGLTVMIGVISLLAIAFTKLPAETIGSILTGMAAFTLMITGLGLAMRTFFASKDVKPGQVLAMAGSIFIISAALVQFAGAVTIFKVAGIGLDHVVLALLPLAAAIGALVGLAFLIDKFSKTMPAVIPTLLGFSGAIALMGIGVASLAVGMTVLGATIDVIGPGLVKLAKYVGLAIVEVIRVLGESSGVIVTAVGQMITAIIQGILTFVPKIESMIGNQTEMVLQFALAAIISGMIAAFTGLPVTLVAIIGGALFLARKDIEKYIMDNAIVVGATIALALGVIMASVKAGVSKGMLGLRLSVVGLIFAEAMWIQTKVTELTGSIGAGVAAAIAAMFVTIKTAINFGLLPGQSTLAQGIMAVLGSPAALLKWLKSTYLLIDTAVGCFFIDFAKALPQKIATLKTALVGANGIPSFGQFFISEIGQTFKSIGNFLKNAFKGDNLIPNFGQYMASYLKKGLDTTQKVLAKMYGFISSIGPWIGTKIYAMQSYIVPKMAALYKVVSAKITWLAGAISAQIQAAWTWITTSAAAGPIMIGAMVALAIAALYLNFKDEIDAALVKAGEAIKQWFEGVAQWFRDGFKWLIEQITGVSMLREIGNFFKNFGQEAGENVVKGFNNGIGQNRDTSNRVIKEYGNGIADSFRQTLEIQSPSRLFAKYGGYIDAGLVNGIESNASNAYSAMTTLASNMLTSFGNEMGIHSPSKETASQAEYMVEGYYNGIRDNQTNITNVMSHMSENILNPLRGARDEAKIIAAQIAGAFGGGEVDVSPLIEQQAVNRKLVLQELIKAKRDEIFKQEQAIGIFDDAPANMKEELVKLENDLKEYESELYAINTGKLSVTAIAKKMQLEIAKEQSKVRHDYRQLGADQKDIDVGMYEALLRVTNKYALKKMSEEDIRSFAKQMYEEKTRNEFQETSEGILGVISTIFGKDNLPKEVEDTLKSATSGWMSDAGTFEGFLGGDLAEFESGLDKFQGDFEGGLGGINSSMSAFQLYQANAWSAFVKDVGENMATITKNLAINATQTKVSADKIAAVADYSADDLQTYISAAKEFNDITLEEQLVMWSNLVAKTKEGTDENYKAQQNYYAALNAMEDSYLQDSLDRIQAQRDARQISWQQQVDALKSLREEYSKDSIVYTELTNKINEAARQQYQVSRNWIENQSSLITKLFGEQRVLATNPNLTIEEKATVNSNIEQLQERILQETQNYYDQKKDIETYNEEEAARLKEEYIQNEQNLLATQTEMVNEENQRYLDAVKARADALYSKFSMFDRAGDVADIDPEYLTSNLQTQLDAINSWKMDINSLAGRRTDEDFKKFIEELRAMGIDAAAEVESLNSMTDDELNKYVALWKSKHELVTSQAEFELTDLKKEVDEAINGKEGINAKVEEALANLAENYNSDLADLNSSTEKQLNSLKETWMINMGLMKKEVTGEVADMVKTVLDQVGETYKWSEESGHILEETTKNILDTVETFADAYDTIIETLRNKHLQNEMYRLNKEVGENGIQGFVTGFIDGRPVLTSSIRSVIGAGVDEVKEVTDTHSPSRVFMEIAGWWIQGLVNGITKNAPTLLSSMKEMVLAVLKQMDGMDDLSLHPVIKPVVEGTGIPIVDTNPVIRPIFDVAPMGMPDLTQLMSLNRLMPLGFDTTGLTSNTKQLQNLNGTTDVTSDQIVTSIASLQNDVQQLSTALRGMQVVLDSGELVGGIVADVDNGLGQLAFYNERGL